MVAGLVVIAAIAVLGFFLVLLERIRGLERRLDALSQRLAASPPPAEAAAAGPQAVTAEAAPPPTPAPPEAAAPEATPQPPTPANRPPRRLRWGSAERSFARFWTGILGALALVTGFSFLAVLTALHMDKFPRFLMLVAISALLYAGSVFAARRQRTGQLGSWLRSAAGALVLFGCFASSAVPWLRWVTSDVQGYAVLAAGIAVNLAFALAGSLEVFASFHTLISLAALAVAPAQGLVLAVAVIVTAACSLPAFRKPWGVHLLLCTSSFFAFFAAWTVRQTSATYATESMAIGGLIIAFLPAFVAPYVSGAGNRFAVAARGATWAYLATGVLLFSRHLQWVSGLLLVLALAAYVLSRTAASRGAAWLPRLDGVAGLGLAVLAALGLVRIDLDLVFVLALAYAATALVSADRGADATVRHAGGILQAALGAAVIVAGLASALGARLPGRLLVADKAQVAAVMAALAALTVVQLRLTPRLPSWVASVLGGFYPAFLIALYGVGLRIPAAPRWAALGGAVFALGGAAGLALDRRSPTPSHRIGLMLAAAIALAASLVAAREVAAMSLAGRVGHGVLLVIVSALALAAPWGAGDRRRASAMPGAFFLAIALGALALSAGLGRDRAWTWLAWSAIVVAARIALPRAARWLWEPCEAAAISLAVAAAVLAAASAGESLALRLASEAAAAGALLAWSREPEGGEPRLLAGPALAAILFLTLYVGIEARGDWQGCALAALAIAALAGGARAPVPLRCLATFSVLPYLASLVSLAWFTGPGAAGDNVILSWRWWAGVAASLADVGYIALFYRWHEPGSLSAAGEAAWLRDVRRTLHEARNLALFGPLYLAIGLFFAWSFGGPALTAIYIVVSFSVFALGIALREPVFRPLSYGLLAYCLVRLVFFDMARADTFDRAVVFIIAGTVLLAMNWLYNRFVGDDEKPASGGEP